MDTSASAGTTYYYRVTAVDKAGNEGGFSGESQATPEDTTPPDVPTSLAATTLPDSVALEWSAAQASDLQRYRVYRDTSPIDSSAGPSSYPALDSTAAGDTTYVDATVQMNTTYYYRVTAVDTTANESGFSEEVTVHRNESGPPPTPSALSATSEQGDVQLDWNRVTATDLQHYRVYRATQPGLDAYSALTTVQAGQTTFTDSSPPSGTSVYYRLTAVDEDGNESPFSEEAVRYLNEMPTGVQQTFGDPTQKQNFELVGLPGREPVSLSAILSGSPPEDWRAFDWDGSFVEADGADAFEPGRGFWILAREAISVDRTVEPVSLNEQGAYEIDLRSGWNLISNPFDIDVSWNRIQQVNGLDAALWQWDERWQQTSTFTSAAEGTAFYVRNREDLDVLTIPYPGLSTLGENQVTQEKGTETGSRLRLAAGQDEQTNTGVQILWGGTAAQGIDKHDRFAPPGRFQPVRLTLQSDSSEAPLAVDARPIPSTEGRRYEMRLQAPVGPPVHVRIDRLSSFPAEEAVLVRRETGEAFPLSGESSVEIPPQSPSSQWILLLGSRSYVEREKQTFTPKTVQLRSNYPNPVQRSTTIQYGLPEAQHVRLTIYDVLGRRVQTLVDEQQSAGMHTARWDGTGEEARVASGMYFYRLQVEDQTKTRKMVVVQ